MRILETRLELVGVEDDGEGTVVDQRNLHVGAKAAARHMGDVRTHQRDKVLVEIVGDFRSPSCKSSYEMTSTFEAFE